MRSATLSWAALALFGLTVTAEGVAGLLAGAGGIGSYVSFAGGLVVLGSAAAGIARGEPLGGDATLARVVTVAGALLYTAASIGKLVL